MKTVQIAAIIVVIVVVVAGILFYAKSGDTAKERSKPGQNNAETSQNPNLSTGSKSGGWAGLVA